MNEPYRRGDYHDRICEEAADWFVLVQEGRADGEIRRKFADWLSCSSEHVREYLALTALFTDIAELPETLGVDELIRLARSDAGNVTVLRERSEQLSAPFGRTNMSRAPRFRWLLAAGVAVAAVTAGIWGWRSDPDSTVYTTAVGEQKSFTLPDGSVVTLNAVSRLQVHYTDEYRDLRLVSGEALFNVAGDAGRPFRVMTPDTVTQAVGTRFNVRTRRADTMVSVIDGRVKVASGNAPVADGRETGNWVMVGPGQGARLGASGRIEVTSVDPVVATAWRDRRLVFDSTPLGEAVAEFNLYNELALQIDSVALRAIRITGAFYANDPSSFALFLREAGLANAEIAADRIRLAAPSEDAWSK